MARYHSDLGSSDGPHGVGDALSSHISLVLEERYGPTWATGDHVS